MLRFPLQFLEIQISSPHPQGEVAKVLQNYVNANKNKTEIGV